MKVCVSLGLGLLLAACAVREDSNEVDGLSVDVMSFNIRYGTADDGDNAWPRRKDLVYDVIRERNSDFVGLQEALRFQIDGIREVVPGYGEVGVGRDDGRQGGEYSAILYRLDRWRTVHSGTFWLSDTPDVPGSMSWGNEFPRLATWARFVEKTSGRSVWVINTHFDHRSQPSREKSAALLASRIADREPDDPVIVTGDFNAGEDNPAITYLTNGRSRSPIRLVDTFRVLHRETGGIGTFSGFEGRRDGPRIDYVFVAPEAQVQEAGIVREQRDGRYPSDHFPVYAKIVLPDARTGGRQRGERDTAHRFAQ
ncbi:MAG: endonuclease/exonuclease/phosphatase family protein [Woeseiaceae bacterium]